MEVQTMDFHGSYRAVVNNLQDALRLHNDSFHGALMRNQQWLSEKIEGPNIANVFKRTFYKIMLKFQIAKDESCAGCVIALPTSVWDSWQRHLGRPELEEEPGGTFKLREPGGHLDFQSSSWIYLFDIETSSVNSPNPIALRQVIATSAEAMEYFALQVAPEAAVAGVGTGDRVLASIRGRISIWWPELGQGLVVLPPRM